ncbi:ankyrin-2-like [Trichogramma pretiosum]|uniref:ankyrin-2-like n=1 Tax=Trichogramma pretiosum TaxID=7493 RepID=UPI000C719D03|nr:ankyrin-2-like [Trichogramma pretiosum]
MNSNDKRKKAMSGTELVPQLTKKIFKKTKGIKNIEKHVIDRLSELLKLGVKVDNLIKDEKRGNTALHCAVKHCQKEVVLFLLEKGADVCAECRGPEGPVSVLWVSNNVLKHLTSPTLHKRRSIALDIRDALLSNLESRVQTEPRFSDAAGLSIFHLKCARGQIEQAREHFSPELIDKKVYFDLMYGCTPLLIAIMYGHFRLAAWLVENAGASVRLTTAEFDQRSSLHVLADYPRANNCEDRDSAQLAETLIQFGANVNSLDADDMTPLDYVYKSSNEVNSIELLRVLVRHGANFEKLSQSIGHLVMEEYRLLLEESSSRERVNFILDRRNNKFLTSTIFVTALMSTVKVPDHPSTNSESNQN